MCALYVNTSREDGGPAPEDTNIRDLVENCAHNDDITPLIRLVFEAQAVPESAEAIDGEQGARRRGVLHGVGSGSEHNACASCTWLHVGDTLHVIQSQQLPWNTLWNPANVQAGAGAAAAADNPRHRLCSLSSLPVAARCCSSVACVHAKTVHAQAPHERACLRMRNPA